MIFSIGKIHYCFLKNTVLALVLAGIAHISPVGAQDYSAAEARAQAEAWRTIAQQARAAGEMAEAAKAETNLRLWESLEKKALAQDNISTPAASVTETQGAWRPERPLNPDYQNNLLAAVQSADQNRVRMLVERGAQGTPQLLQMALDAQQLGIAALLIRYGAGTDPNLPHTLGRALIQAVASSRSPQYLDTLIRLGANVNYTDNGLSPAQVALNKNNFEMLAHLAARGAKRDTAELSRLLAGVAAAGDTTRARQLALAGADPTFNIKGKNALSEAFAADNMEMIKALTSGGVRIKDTDLTGLLLQAVARNQPERVNLLISIGADVNRPSSKGVRPLMIAMYNNNLAMANMLIRSGATDPEGHYASKTFDAALNGDVQWLRVLIQIPSYIQYRNNEGETPLHAAASRGHTQAVIMLVKAGIDPNVLTSLKGWTPIHHAARFGHMETVNELLRLGANAYAVNSDGNDAAKLVRLSSQGVKQDAASSKNTQRLLELLGLWKKYHPLP
ncbi:MAG: hypothetical protein CR991_01480 [Proteobacteria bacterium]|nr:MAG: hypothetical protein CR991_01480 [Pseudomonadota bacterium]